MYFVGIDISKFKHDCVNPLSSISFFQALPPEGPGLYTLFCLINFSPQRLDFL